MKQRNYILSRTIGFLCIFALLLPSAVQFSHLFEEHEHVACTDITTHLHEKEFDCHIHDFHGASFDFMPLTSVPIVPPEAFYQNNFRIRSISEANIELNVFLRGPPRFQQFS